LFVDGGDDDGDGIGRKGFWRGGKRGMAVGFIDEGDEGFTGDVLGIWGCVMVGEKD
jgi:hypothetical protein